MVGRLRTWRLAWRLGAALAASVLIAFEAQAFTLRVEDPNGVVISQYRWLLEEDNTHDSRPFVPTPQGLGVDISRSHAPVIKSGQRNVPQANISVPDPNKRYFISVLPSSGDYALGGAPVAPGQQDVKVIVQPLPLPTAQITVEVFHDNGPINNVKDAGEAGLAGFKVVINDTFGQLLQDAFGNPLGNILTDAEGKVVIKNLAPGKYGVTVTPPPGTNWQQTSTIEGTKTIDAWVRAGEPDFFIENGPPEAHAFFGFVQPFVDSSVLMGGETITGRVVNMHMARPPEFSFWPGHPIPSCWVGLNEGTGLVGRGLFAAPCADDSSFAIPNVPPGNYQLVIWDANLDVIFASQNIEVTDQGECLPNPSRSCDLGDVAVFNWFARIENYVFADVDGDGFPDGAENGEIGIPEQNVNLRFRDGTLYQAFPTDMEGYAPFDEVFPFFKFLVAEVDFARFKATGVTVVVDGGGQVQPAHPEFPHLYPDYTLSPQQQLDPITRETLVNPNTGDALSRTEMGPVLTQATQNFLGTTSVIHWGKAPYAPGENGGISGIVYYAVTRAEDDPRFAQRTRGNPASRACRWRCTPMPTMTASSTITTATAP
ncbi:MAG: hypothetical protein AB7U81_06875 [Thiohalomonadaceae bacterium]